MTIDELAPKMRALGVRSVSIDPDGSVRDCELFPDLPMAPDTIAPGPELTPEQIRKLRDEEYEQLLYAASTP